MKVTRTLALILFIATMGLTFQSCFLKGSKYSAPLRQGEDSKIGWYYNDPDWGNFRVVDVSEQPTGPGLVFIEGGTFVMGNPEQDITYSWNAIRRRVTVSSFYMDETEVSNLNYRIYVSWLLKVFGKQYPQVYQEALPDTLVWRRPLAYNEPLVTYYFRYPAYNDYPVVGVNWVQATKYSAWRTDRVNEKILIENGILDKSSISNLDANSYFVTDLYLAGLYNSANGDALNNTKNPDENQRSHISLEDGLILPRYRLPTEAEWEFAAYALIGNTQDERISGSRIYPWNGHYLRNPDRAYRGLFMANFKRGRGDYMGVAGYLNDGYAPTAPVDAFWPNDYGLYNMAGNVNEWVLDVYRPLSYVDFDDFNPFRGNVFKTMVLTQDGKPAVDSTGHIIYRLMGQDPTKVSGVQNPKQVDVSKELQRYNYQTADNRNYLDGDLRSTLGPTWLADQAPDYKGTSTMYSYGKSSLINDESRVYKGGSWRDLPYWLVPGTRRFMDQNRSTDDIGFRCAMIHVGNPSQYQQ